MNKYKIEIKWAIIFTVFMLLWMVMEKMAGLHDKNIEMHATVTMLVAIPAILIYVLALLDKRKNFYNNVMSYKQAFISGLIISLIIMLFTPLTQYITSTVITPDYFDNMIKYAVAEGKLTQEAAEAEFNLRNYMIASTVFAPIMGIITTAIVAIFVRKS